MAPRTRSAARRPSTLLLFELPTGLLEELLEGIAGHLHPGIRIKESARQSLRITGFMVRDSKHLILPAFSQFTGTSPLKMSKKDQFFTEINGVISEIPSELTQT